MNGAMWTKRWTTRCGLALGLACSLVACQSNRPQLAPALAVDALPQMPPLKAGRTRPLVVVLADSAGTETSDFIVPYGVLKESGVAQVLGVSTSPGPVPLMPALRMVADTSVAAFDRDVPSGADVLIVPAMHDPRSAPLLDFVRRQAAGGALVVSVCEGAWVLAHAGLFEGRRATAHWYAIGALARRFPGTTWLLDRRYVADGRVMSTTGVTASVPASLALVEAIAGRQVAQATALRLGETGWGSEQDSSRFGLDVGRMGVVAGNWLAAWRHETIAIPVALGVDEIALALQSDAWSRTYRSSAVALNPEGRVVSRRGLTLLTEPGLPAGTHSVSPHAGPSARALDDSLLAIAGRYGAETADMVANELEYPWR